MVLSDVPALQLTYLICLQVLAELCFQGYRDAIRFLEENGMYGRGNRCALLLSFLLAASVNPRSV